MNILVLCPHFAPDPAATGEVMTSIATELVARGHQLEVITSLPWYVDHAIEPGWEGQLVRTERTSWGRVVRVHPFPSDKTNIPARAAAFGGFTVLATAMGLASRRRPDVVMAMAPPPTMGMAGWAVARRHRVPLVFNIQDVFPDVAIELGVLQDPRLIAAAYRWEALSYRRADAVTVLSDDLADNVRAKLATGRSAVPAGDAAAKVHVIPNFVDTQAIQPAPQENAYRAEYGLEGKRVVMYAGNVGFSQSLDLVLAAAADLADEPDIAVVINGGGAARADLQRAAAGLPNVVFVDMQPKARIPEVLAAADVHVVPLKRGLARSSVPSKLYGILAAARPIVASVDPGTEVARTVERAGAGLAVPPDDAPAFTAALRQLLDAPDRRRTMGEAGRRWVEGWASPAAVAEAYEQLFERTRLQVGRSRLP